LSEAGWRPPAWIYRERRPSNDDKYFENMTRVIFQAGLGWKMIDRKWHNFKKAFADFSVDKVAQFEDVDMKRLLKDEGIVRNRVKIESTIQNAREFKKIKTEHGSFQSYLDSLDKSNNYALVIKELGKRFQRLGPSSARLFLYSVGEDVRHPQEKSSFNGF